MHLKDFEEHMTLILDGHEILAEDVDMSQKLDVSSLEDGRIRFAESILRMRGTTFTVGWLDSRQ